MTRSLSQYSHYSMVPNGGSGTLQSPVHASAALRWFETMRDRQEWALSVDEQCELLGGIPRRTFQVWKKKALNREPVDLSRDVMERLSLLLGIYKAYQLVTPANRPELAGEWFQTPNDHALFQGQSVKTFLLSRGTMAALYAVRRYLDAARG
ncbi:antitoxin Xre-like helix-turn-helix domain-containing protein [Reinekea blandensis]|nr:antitoxin Xre-like helix-turn-helix domain-containing protein [Reinekea blandensis]